MDRTVGEMTIADVDLSDRNKAPGWDAAIESLVFYPARHDAICAVHKHVFRTLLGRAVTPEDCIAYFIAQHSAFQAAATAKILRDHIATMNSLHINSRDVKRQLLVVSC